MLKNSIKSSVVRINGRRVDISKIENSLCEYKFIEEAAVIFKKNNKTSNYLVAFVKCSENHEVTLSEIKENIDGCEYIDSVVMLSTLPLNKEGDIDRSLLDSFQVLKNEEVESITNNINNIKDNIIIYNEDFEKYSPLKISDIKNKLYSFNSSIYPKEIDEVYNKKAYVSGGKIAEVNDNVNNLIDILVNAAKVYSNSGITNIDRNGHTSFISYLDLLNKSEIVLNSLRKAGLKDKENVILLLDDNEKYYYAFWGCILGGYVPAPMTAVKNSSSNSNEIKVLKSVYETLENPYIISTKNQIDIITSENHDFNMLDIDSLLYGEKDNNFAQVNNNDTAVLLFTSGSTGKPKGVMQTHINIVKKQRAAVQFGEYNNNDIMINWLSLEHVVGLIAFHIMPMYLGANQVHIETDYILEAPLRWLDLITKYKGTITWAPNSLFALLNDYIDDDNDYNWDLSTVKRFINAGETVNNETCRKLLLNLMPYGFPKDAIKPEWGMSETCCMTIASDKFNANNNEGIRIVNKNYLDKKIIHCNELDPEKVVFVECGNIYPGLEMRVVDNDYSLLNEGEIGRFQIKGETVLPGYYKNPKANEESFLEDGWFDTGDLAFIYNGSVTFTGRIKDVIIINGINYQNVDIETCVEEIQGIDVSFTAAVAVKEDADDTDKLAIFFVPLDNDEDFIKDQIVKIKDHVQQVMSLNVDYIIPVNREIIPKTNIGKIQRSQLAKRFESGEFDEIISKFNVNKNSYDYIPQWFYEEGFCKKNSKEKNSLNNKKIIIYGNKNLGNKLTSIIEQSGGICYNISNISDFKDVYNSNNISIFINLRNYEAELLNLSTKDKIYFVNETIYETKEILNILSDNKLLYYYIITNNSLMTNLSKESYIYGTLEGYIKSLNEEENYIFTKIIDVDINSNENHQNVFKEICNENKDEIVVYRDNERYIKHLNLLDIKERSYNETNIINNGVYLVAGALGGIGIEVSNYLISKLNCKLILVGRTKENELTANKKKILEKFKQINKNTIYLDADISNEIEVDKLKKLILDKYDGNISGIFNLAGMGNFEDNYNSIEHFCINESKDYYEELFKAKLFGTINLVNLIDKDKLFVNFSSVNSYFGGVSYSAYSAANSFLNALTKNLRKEGYSNSYSINWSSWDKIGMSKNDIYSTIIKNKGFNKISKYEGIKSLEALLKSDIEISYVGLDSSNNNIKRELYKKKNLQLTNSFIYEGINITENNDLHQLNYIFDNVIYVKKLPRDNSNYIDMKNLRKICLQNNSNNELILPETETEKSMASIWRKVLNVDDIGKNYDFFNIGGHSLNAAKLIALIREEFSVKISLNTIFKCSTLEKLSQEIDKQKEIFTISNEDESYVIPNIEKEYYNLSFSQRRVYFLEMMEKQNGVYNILGAWDIKGNINLDILKTSINELVKRHEMLRTTFSIINGEPVQYVHKDMNIPINIINIEDLPDNMKSEKIEDVIYNETKRKYNLSQGPLMFCTYLKVSNEDSILLISQHHIITDGWSLGILITELNEIYNGLSNNKEYNLPKINVNTTSFIEWNNKVISDDKIHKEYWMEKLKDSHQVLDLPIDKERPLYQTYNGDTLTINIEGNLKEKLEIFNEKNKSTMFMTLLVAYYIMLYKLTGQEDIIVGVPVAGRNEEETKGLIGMFVNSLPIKCKVIESYEANKLLLNIKENMLEAYEHESYPFDKIVEDINPERDMNHSPIFQTMFNYLDLPIQINFDKVQTSEHIVRHKIAKFDLSINILNLEGIINVSFEFNTDLFNESTILRWQKYYLNIINEIINNEKITISNIDMIPLEEKNKILSINTKREYPRNSNLVSLFEEIVNKYEDKVALKFKDKTLTYKELNEKANKISSELIRNNAKKEDIIGVIANRSIETIISILGIIKAGCAYIPINKKYPDSMIINMLEEANCNIVLGEGNKEEFYTNINWIDVLKDYEAMNFENNSNSKDLAYIIYTSGTTGKPKGVKVNHRNIIRLVKGSSWIELKAEDTILQTGTLSFDASTFEIWGALLNGLTLCLIEEEDILNPEHLSKEIIKNNVSIMWVSSPLFNQLIESKNDTFNGCKTLVVGGDKLSTKHINLARKSCDSINIINGYGPTENTTFSTTYKINKDLYDYIPIGKPLSNSTAYILNKNLSLQPIGVIGELYVGGDGVSDGYLCRDELTNERFISDPFNKNMKMYKTGDYARLLEDGNIQFVGRMDKQVKIRGFRIELNAIELALKEKADIKDAIIQVSDDEKYKNLIGYIVSDNKDLNQKEVINYLKTKLPEYMIPTMYVFIENIPLNSNGKVDLKKLPKISADTKANNIIVHPESKIEIEILQIFKEVLNVNEIGVMDSFFENGGDSLLTIKLSSKLKEIGYETDPKLIFMYPNVRDLSKEIINKEFEVIRERAEKDYLIKLHDGNEENSRIFFAPPAGGTVLGYIELSRHFSKTGSTYGIQSPGLYEDEETTYLGYDEMVDFSLKAIEECYRPGIDYLAGHSLGGHFAFGVCNKLTKEGKAPKGLIILDTIPTLKDASGNDNKQDINEEEFKLFVLAMGIGNILEFDPDELRNMSYEEARRKIIEESSKNEKVKYFMNKKYLDKYLKMQLHHMLLSKEVTLPNIKLDIPIYAFRTLENDSKVIESFNDWSNYTTKKFSIIDISGNHTTMMRLPHVKDLASKIENNCFNNN